MQSLSDEYRTKPRLRRREKDRELRYIQYCLIFLVCVDLRQVNENLELVELVPVPFFTNDSQEQAEADEPTSLPARYKSS